MFKRFSKLAAFVMVFAGVFCPVAQGELLLHLDGELIRGPVFQGAMGFGVNTSAGNYGRVIKVTNLNPSGPGSFAEAVKAEGPRLVVFEVGGVIEFEDPDWLVISEPYLTIAGQTAPSPGITIIKQGIQIRTHDVLIQHIRVRPGDADKVRVPWNIDALTTVGSDAYNIVIDHCSFSWGTDESLSVSGPRLGPDETSRRVTLSNNIVSETLYESINSKRFHSRGTLIHDFCRDIAVIRNIYAHNNRRSPVFKVGTTGVIANNLIYDPGVVAIHTQGSMATMDDPDIVVDPPRWSIVGNHVIPGPSTTIDSIFYSHIDECIDPAEVYFYDNICDDEDVLQTKGRVSTLSKPPAWPDNLVVLPVDNVYDELLAHAGARAADRDEVDARIIEQIQNRTGGLIDSQDDVGGYPDPEPTYRALEVPEDILERMQWLAKMARQVEGR